MCIERCGAFQACRCDSSHHLGDVAGVKVLIARVFPFRRKGQVEILAHLQPVRCSRGSIISSVVPG